MNQDYPVYVGMKLIDSHDDTLSADVTSQDGDYFRIEESRGEVYSSFTAEDIRAHYRPADAHSHCAYITGRGVEVDGHIVTTLPEEKEAPEPDHLAIRTRALELAVQAQQGNAYPMAWKSSSGPSVSRPT